MDPSAILLSKLDVSFDQLIQYQWDHFLAKHLFAGCAALLFYNHVLTAREEWKFVWSNQIGPILPKALYVIIRYFSLVWAVMHWIYLEYHVCSVGQVGGWIAIINFAAIDLVFILRVWILYNLSRGFSLVVVAGSIACLVTALVIRAYQPHIPLPFVKAPPTSLTACFYSKPQEYFLVSVLGLMSQVFIFSLLLGRMWKEPIATRLSRVLLLHAMVYFGIITTLLSLNMISALVPELYVPLLESDVVVPISSITCSQLILSLKRSSLEEHGDPPRGPKDKESGSIMDCC